MASPSGDDPRPELVGDADDAVAFLDAPGLSARRLLAAVVDVLATMPDGAILTVFTDDPDASHLAADWARGDVELVAVIPHGERAGTTLTFRRSETGPESTAAGLPTS